MDVLEFMGETDLIAITDPDAMPHILNVLAAGKLAAMPTETVYGLFADATNASAVALVYAAKGRPQFNPLISHVASQAMAHEHGILTAALQRCTQAFWPGPLTVVVTRNANSSISDLACAGLDTVALRCPDAPFLRSVIEKLGVPLAGPSANRSGRISPTDAQAVYDDLAGTIPAIINGGRTVCGLESTVIAEHEDGISILRPGTITGQELEAVAQVPVSAAAKIDDASPQSPGLLTRHYAPETPIRLNATTIETGEALLAFSQVPAALAAAAVNLRNLSETGDLVEAASNLYSDLRALDRTGSKAIAVMPIPNTGLGLAINDRLQRASAKE